MTTRATSVRERLATEMGALLAELDADLARVANLTPVAAIREEVARLRLDLVAQRERATAPVIVTLVGATGAGKSTLLNSLAGRPVATEGVNRPTTMEPVVYAPSDAALDDLVGALPGPAPRIERYRGEEGSPWSKHVLIDAPDVNSIEGEHREVVRTLAERSDALLVLVHPQSIAEEVSVRFVAEFAGRRRVLPVLGRADELVPAAREELLGELARVAEEHWGGEASAPLAVSPRAAREGGGDASYAALCESLEELVRERALLSLRSLNAIGAAQALGELLGTASGEARKELMQLSERARVGAERFAERLSNAMGERLALRKSDLLAELGSETARRWDGPGGYALRAGGLSGVGLGAGALLLRRNPLLAAGAAAGTFAADRAKGAMARARLSDSEGLAPREREIEALFLDELGEARLVVERLSGTPTGLGLPGLEQARERAEQAVEDARSELVEKELLHSADRAMHPYARLAADAPVYALLAWVVLHAGMVLIGRESEFTDFLISALLLVAVYLFVLGVLVRRRLGSCVEALIAGGVESARKTLAGWAGELGDGVDRACEAPVQALERLASLGQRWRASIEALERPAANSGASEAESLD